MSLVPVVWITLSIVNIIQCLVLGGRIKAKFKESHTTFSSGGIWLWFISTTPSFIQFVSHACFEISMYYLNNNNPFLKDHGSGYFRKKILLKQYEKLILIKICYLYTINELLQHYLENKKHDAPYHPTHTDILHTFHPSLSSSSLLSKSPRLNDITPRCLYPTPPLTIWSQPVSMPSSSPTATDQHHPFSLSLCFTGLLHVPDLGPEL